MVMVEVITPLKKASHVFLPGIFLAGPIQGARDWQTEAINLITEKTKDIKKNFFVASPRAKECGKDYIFEAQVDWESEYLHQAGMNGVIMFWLCNESEHFCNRAYAQTTRYELAEWVTIAKNWGIKIVIGFDTNFSGTKYIKHRLKSLKGSNSSEIYCFDSFEETVNKTVSLLKEKINI